MYEYCDDCDSLRSHLEFDLIYSEIQIPIQILKNVTKYYRQLIN